jgi:hypothetical protein
MGLVTLSKEPIWVSADFTFQDTQTIKELIKRKNKYARLKQNREKAINIFIILSCITLLVFGSQIILNPSPYEVLMETIKNELFLLLVIGLSIILAYPVAMKPKEKEEKENYHTLRKEVSEKTEGPWLKRYGESTIMELIKQLKKEYDIEISYKG